VNNSVGTFLPADPAIFGLTARAYDLRHIIFGLSEEFAKASKSSDSQASPSSHRQIQQSGGSTINSGRHFEAVASFTLIWWNQGSNSRKKLSIWRPVVPQGMVYFGDIAVKE
jgi:vacuolar protein sorting-associated protein 13A/C